MVKTSTFRNQLLALLREKNGNFGMMTAILLPVSIGVVGLGMDVNTMVQSKRTLQNAVDAAALATATAMTNDMTTSDADTMAKSFVLSQMSNISSTATSSSANLTTTSTITTTSSSTGKTYDVALTSSYIMTMNPLSTALGWKTVTVKAIGKAEASTSSSGGNPLSMYLALDRSGSMNENTTTTYTTTCETMTWNRGAPQKTTYSCTQYYTKIQALKIAVQSLATQLNSADPNSKYVRTGADSYNASADAEQVMSWGTSNVVNYVNALNATGGTDATGALGNAYAALKTANSTEATAHGTSKFGRYIVFMTDGEMTGNSNTWNSAIDTTVRNSCSTIKSNGIVIFTVAFNAPDTGKSLLQACASDSAHYYEATDSASLVSAFGAIGKAATKSSTRLTN
jgi:Flp pilus assembly protein TadG